MSTVARPTGSASAKIQRRLLRFLNAAQLPEDFLEPPQFARTTTGAHRHRPHGVHAGHGPSKDPWQNAKLDRRLAIDIIRQRPPFGWREIGMLAKIHERMLPDFCDRFIGWLGPPLTVNGPIEVFNPPYLFRGARPVITALPPRAPHGALWFTRATATRLAATMPEQKTVAPVGYYMLFIPDNAGVPSVARFIQLR